MKKMFQFRYYGQSVKNYPLELNETRMSNHTLFQGKGSITHLGIQASPGTTFFLNKEADHPIQIGKTGIFELDVSGYGYITHIAFATKSLELVNEDNGIIIDILYEGGSI